MFVFIITAQERERSRRWYCYMASPTMGCAGAKRLKNGTATLISFCPMRGGMGSPADQQRAMAEDVAALLRALKLGPVRLGGHSMGAGVAAAVASMWPELVSAVMLEDGGLFRPHEQRTSSPEEIQQRFGWLFEVRVQSLEERKAACQKNTGWSEITVEQWAISKEQLNVALLPVSPAPVSCISPIQAIASASISHGHTRRAWENGCGMFDLLMLERVLVSRFGMLSFLYFCSSLIVSQKPPKFTP